jgi:hypothetical protein
LLAAPLVGPLMFDVSAMYVNYYREDVAAGRGQMLMFNPSLGLPWRFFDAVDVFQRFQYLTFRSNFSI